MKTNSSDTQVSRTPLQEKIFSFLASGLSPAVVASATGASTSYISELLGDAEFAEAVAAERGARSERAAKIDDTYEELEENLLEKYGELVKSGGVYKPRDLLEGLKMVNGAKKKVVGVIGGMGMGNGGMGEDGMGRGNTYVQIVLPQHTRVNYTKDEGNRIVEVNGRPMLSATAGALRNAAAGAAPALRADPAKRSRFSLELQQIADSIPYPYSPADGVL